MARSLNPFEFRASFDPSSSTNANWKAHVLIPLNSGLHLIGNIVKSPYPNLGLNPFEFRASFDHILSVMGGGVLGLNPFEFRASFDPICSAVDEMLTKVLIPLNSGLHLISAFNHSATAVEVLIPLNSGLHLIWVVKSRPVISSCLNPFEFRASFDLQS